MIFRRLLRLAVEIGGWGLLAALQLVISGVDLTRSIPTGHERSTTVPLFNAWTVQWNVQRAAHGYAAYWHAPIFHPQPGTFTFSEMQPTTAVVAPILWCGGSLALAYNLYLCLNLALAATLTRQLLRQSGSHWPESLLAAWLVFHLPFVRWQLGVLQLTAIWGPLAVILAAARLGQRPGWFRGVWLGLAAAACYAACHHYGLFIALVSPALLILVWPVQPDERRKSDPASSAAQQSPQQRWWSVARAVTCSLVVALAVASPLLWAQLEYLSAAADARSPQLVQRLSAIPVQYLQTACQRWEPLSFAAAAGGPTQPLGPGSALLLLAVLAAVNLFRAGPRAFWRGPGHRWRLFWISVAALAAVLSLGSRLSVLGWKPWPWLADYLLPLQLIRSPFRLAVFVQLAAVCLAAPLVGSALRQLRRADTDRTTLSGRLKRLAAATVLALAFVAVVQTWPTLPNSPVRLSDTESEPQWISWLRQQTPQASVVAWLPFPQTRSLAAYEPTVRCMLAGLQFQRPVVNGYSGFFPDHYRRLRVAVSQFPDADSLLSLRNAGVRYVILSTGEPQDAALVTRLPQQSAVRIVFRDREAAVLIAELVRPADSGRTEPQ